MPTFDTPEPITLRLELGAGRTRIIASDRITTEVQVRPMDPASKSDHKSAEQTRVEFNAGRLLVSTPKSRGLWQYFGKGDSTEITIEVPTGSHIRGAASWMDFQGEGQLGNLTLELGGGDVHLDQVEDLRLDLSAGDVTVTQVAGRAVVNVTHGEVNIRELASAAEIKNSSGGCSLGEAHGELRAKTAYGDISVDRAHDSVEAKTAYGSVRLGEVHRGSIVAETAYGKLDIGVRKGTAAWLDASSQTGQVRNQLEPTDAPDNTEDTVQIRARNSYGDIVIHRS